MTAVEDFVSRRMTDPSITLSQSLAHGTRTNTTIALVGITGLPLKKEENIFKNNNNWSGINVYDNQCGWRAYTFGGISRWQFIFRDSATTNAYKHAGNYDEYQLQFFSGSAANFAGVVCIRD